VVAVEETADTIYLVLPSTSSLGDKSGELSDLEAVSGGGTWADQTCASCDPCVRTI
jgi:hypothetical protein